MYSTAKATPWVDDKNGLQKIQFCLNKFNPVSVSDNWSNTSDNCCWNAGKLLKCWVVEEVSNVQMFLLLWPCYIPSDIQIQILRPPVHSKDYCVCTIYALCTKQNQIEKLKEMRFSLKSIALYVELKEKRPFRNLSTV